MSSVYSSYIKRMRMCVNGNCKGCTYQYEGLTNTEECKEDLLYDAAEQLEDADKCNARLVKKCKEMEKRIAELNTKCADSQSQINSMENEIEELLPKEGEWIIKPHGTYGQLRAFCSACGKHSGIGGIVSNQKKPYCPNCGARMRKGELL